MIDFELDGDAPALLTLQQKLEALPTQVAATLTAWQTADMNRRQPNTLLQDNVAQTSITPTRRKPKRRALRHRRRTSARPLLRAGLFEKLTQRMSSLLESLSWR